MANTNTTKDLDRNKPLHRINSPSYSTSRTQLPGNGIARGCHTGADAPEDTVVDLIAAGLMRTIPGWVYALPGEAEEVHEVEGVLDRSFQTWTDMPVFQFHRWYDWNFHIAPDPGYSWLRGVGNEAGGAGESSGGRRRVVASNTMECEWDCGAFGPRPGPMFGARFPWPMTGAMTWLAGRPIYDCGHAHHGLMRSELHPCQAMATAWFEADKFDENEYFTPALKFLFVASREGGYMRMPPLNSGDLAGNDYEFIVDLPEHEAAEGLEVPIGHTPDFPANTIVLRGSGMITRFDFAPFGNLEGTRDSSTRPVVEQISDTQAKITVPVTSFAADVSCYGVIVSIGWLDPDNAQARKVKRCRVRFRNLWKGGQNHDYSPEEWIFKPCVNGRWFHWTRNGIRNDRQYNLPGSFNTEFWLHEDQHIVISAHGAETDGTHDVMLWAQGRRTVERRINGRNVGVARWADHIDTDNRTHLHSVFHGLVDLMPLSSKDESDPLGIIDAGRGPASERNINPLPIKDLADDRDYDYSLTAFLSIADDDLAELFQDRSELDYRLRFRVNVKTQEVT